LVAIGHWHHRRRGTNHPWTVLPASIGGGGSDAVAVSGQDGTTGTVGEVGATVGTSGTNESTVGANKGTSSTNKGTTSADSKTGSVDGKTGTVKGIKTSSSWGSNGGSTSNGSSTSDGGGGHGNSGRSWGSDDRSRSRGDSNSSTTSQEWESPGVTSGGSGVLSLDGGGLKRTAVAHSIAVPEKTSSPLAPGPAVSKF